MERNNPFIRTSEKYTLNIYKYNQYELECYIFKSKPNKPSLYVWDLQIELYHYVGDFYRFWWRAKEIKEDLLPTIDEVMERNWGDEVLVSELLTVIIEPQKTYFTNKNNLDEGKREAIGDNRMQLETKDFKEITLKWLEFLENL